MGIKLILSQLPLTKESPLLSQVNMGIGIFISHSMSFYHIVLGDRHHSQEISRI